LRGKIECLKGRAYTVDKKRGTKEKVAEKDRGNKQREGVKIVGGPAS